MSRKYPVRPQPPSPWSADTLAPLSREQERLHILRAQAGDAESVSILVRANIRFIRDIAAQYTSSGVDYDDLMAEGAMGLTIAIERFDPDLGFKLITYAVNWIRQRMQTAVREFPSPIHIPTSQLDSLARIRRHQNCLSQQLRRRVVRSEAVLDLQEQGQRVPNADEHGHTPFVSVSSLDAEMPDQHGDPFTRDCPDPEALARVEEPVADAERQAIIRSAMERTLNDRERLVIELYFGMLGRSFTLEEIGKRLHVTRERSRQLRNRALSKIKKEMSMSPALKEMEETC